MKTMLNKVVAIGNMTVAHDITGIETLGVIIAGLSSGTACKVVTCDTANGSYIDFAELVPSTLASSSYNSGFVLPLTGAKKYIKVTGASLAVGFVGDCNYDINKAVYNAVEIPSGADLENNHEVTITENGEIEITPSAGKAGMKKVTATVNVSSGAISVDEIKQSGAVKLQVGATVSLSTDTTRPRAIGLVLNPGQSTIYGRIYLTDLIALGSEGSSVAITSGPGDLVLKLTAEPTGTSERYTVTAEVVSVSYSYYGDGARLLILS